MRERRSIRIDCVIGSNILKTFLLAAMLSEGVSWKGAIAKLAAQNVVAIGTITVRINSITRCGREIGSHGEWKLRVAGRVFVDTACMWHKALKNEPIVADDWTVNGRSQHGRMVAVYAVMVHH